MAVDMGFIESYGCVTSNLRNGFAASKNCLRPQNFPKVAPVNYTFKIFNLVVALTI